MKDIKVASVQFNHSAGDKESNFKILEEFVKNAAAQGVELIAFPEMCITGYWHVRNLSKTDVESLSENVPSGPSTQRLLFLSKQHRIIIGAGLIEMSEEGALFNSYVVAMPNGQYACHRKLHCFINEYMASGETFTVFETPLGWKVGILICWDNNLVENARITALEGADILLAPHQTGGCDSRSPGAMGLIDPKLWEARQSDPKSIEAEFKGPKGRGWLMRWLPSRAHDNGMFLVFSNGVGMDDNEVRTGNAMILDPYGQVLAETWKAEDCIVVTELKAQQLEMCTGRRWIRGRRPKLYSSLSKEKGGEFDPRSARFSRDQIETT